MHAPQIPLTTSVRETSDAGAPIVVSQPGSPVAAAYIDLARRVHARLLEAAKLRDAGAAAAAGASAAAG